MDGIPCTMNSVTFFGKVLQISLCHVPSFLHLVQQKIYFYLPCTILAEHFILRCWNPLSPTFFFFFNDLTRLSLQFQVKVLFWTTCCEMFKSCATTVWFLSVHFNNISICSHFRRDKSPLLPMTCTRMVSKTSYVIFLRKCWKYILVNLLFQEINYFPCILSSSLSENACYNFLLPNRRPVYISSSIFCHVQLFHGRSCE